MLKRTIRGPSYDDRQIIMRIIQPIITLNFQVSINNNLRYAYMKNITIRGPSYDDEQKRPKIQ